MSRPAADWDDWIKQHWAEVYSLLVAATGDRALAEDLAQDIWLTAWRKGLRAGPGARAWFRRAARYVALNANRKAHPRALDPEALAAWMDAQAVNSEEVGGGFEEEREDLRRCLKALPEADRELLADFYDKQRPIVELAKASGQSPGYVKQRLFRLRLELRACLERRRKGSTAHD